MGGLTRVGQETGCPRAGDVWGKGTLQRNSTFSPLPQLVHGTETQCQAAHWRLRRAELQAALGSARVGSGVGMGL